MNLQLAGIHTPGSALSRRVPDPSWRFLGLAVVGVLVSLGLDVHPRLAWLVAVGMPTVAVLEGLGLVWWWGR